MHENEISYVIRGCIVDVYKLLGPGLFESTYETALIHELETRGMNVKSQVALPLVYKDIKMEAGYRIDILVNNKVIVEVKSVEHLAEVHHKQIVTYLKLSGLRLGLLVNFNTDDILGSIYRRVNSLYQPT